MTTKRPKKLRGPGRPRLDPGGKLGASLRVRVTRAQTLTLDVLLAEHGPTRSDAVRWLIDQASEMIS